MLQIRAEAFGFESRPGGVLVHGGRVLAPGRELVGVGGDFLLQGFDGGGVFVEEDLVGGRVSGCDSSMLWWIAQRDLRFHNQP